MTVDRESLGKGLPQSEARDYQTAASAAAATMHSLAAPPTRFPAFSLPLQCGILIRSPLASLATSEVRYSDTVRVSR